MRHSKGQPLTGAEFAQALADAGIDAAWLRARSIEEGECWLWQQGTTRNGYPQASLRRIGLAGLMPRRVAAALAGRPPADGQPVRMRCGCRLCVNPAHALPSSAREIGRLAAKRGGWQGAARAAKISAARLQTSAISADAVIAIRMAEGGTLQAVCSEHGVSYHTAKAIRTGRIRRDYRSPWAGMGARRA